MTYTAQSPFANAHTTHIHDLGCLALGKERTVPENLSVLVCSLKTEQLPLACAVLDQGSLVQTAVSNPLAVQKMDAPAQVHINGTTNNVEADTPEVTQTRNAEQLR